MIRNPHFKLVQFLRYLVDAWNPNETTSLQFRDQIKKAILDRQIAINTASVYLTAVKRGSMEKAVHPMFLITLRTQVNEGLDHKHAQAIQANDQKELKQFE